MKTSLLLFCILWTIGAEAQIKRLTFKAAANYSVIPAEKFTQKITPVIPSAGYTSIPVNIATLKESYESKPGFDVGSSVDYTISSRFFITTGLNFSFLRYKRTFTIEKLSGDDLNNLTGNAIGQPLGSIIFRDVNGNPLPESVSIQHSENKGKTSTLYLQIPVLIGTSFFQDKLLIRGGVSFSYLLSASVYTDRYSINSGLESYKDNSRDGYNSLLASGTISATYMVTKSLGIDLGANKFLSPIFGGSEAKSKYNTFSAGLNCTLNR